MATKFNISKEELTNLYQFYSCTQIAAKYDVCAEIVRRQLHKYEIPVLKVGGRRAFDPPKAILDELYQTKSMADIAKHFGVGETVVFKRLKEHGITLKQHINHRLKPGRVFTESHKAKIAEAAKAREARGSKNPNWKGGVSIEAFNARNSWQAKEWKKKSLARANNCCEKCGKVNNSMCECCGVVTRLHVHHIKSFARFPESRYDEQNSLVLCPKCHYIEHQMKIV